MDEVVQRFWKYIARIDDDDSCWLWTGGLFVTGYGQFWPGGRTIKAHRYSWALEYGAIPDGMWVLHRCDVRRCVRPSHLFLGDVVANTADMVRKGRQARGTKNHVAKLDESTVVIIRQLWSEGGTTQDALAARFGVNQSQISRAIHRERWKHIPSLQEQQ